MFKIKKVNLKDKYIVFIFRHKYYMFEFSRHCFDVYEIDEMFLEV